MLPGVFATRYESEMATVRTRTQWLVLAASLLFLLTLPLYISDYWATWCINVCVWVIAVLGLHFLTGLCGLFSVAQAALMAVGAYTTGILTSNLDWSPWATLPLAALMTGLVGVVFGMPALRIKGFYFAMATIAASFLILWTIGYLDEWTGGHGGLLVPRIKLAGIDFSQPDNYLYIAMILAIVMILFSKNIQRTTTGRVLVAIRDNDLAAQVMGINLFRYKTLALLLTSICAGVAGWVWAHFIIVITPEQFGLITSVWMIGALFIGGMGNLAGAVVGTIALKLLDILTDEAIIPVLSDVFPSAGMSIPSYAGIIVYALILIGFIILEPRGLIHRWEMLKSSYRLFPFSY